MLAILALIGVAGSNPAVLLPCLFGVGAPMMFPIPTIQVRLTDFAPDAPTLMGTLNLAALNLGLLLYVATVGRVRATPSPVRV